MARNKYQQTHPEWFDKSGRIKVEILRELIEYDPETGEMRWRARSEKFFSSHQSNGGGTITTAGAANNWNARNAGKPVGSEVHLPNGRLLMVNILNKRNTAGVLAYAIHHGEYLNGPTVALDGDATNLKIENLASKSDAAFFSKKGTSKYFGVCRTARGSYSAHIRIDGKQRNLGTYKKEEDAADAYDVAAIRYFGKSAMTNDAYRQPDQKPPKPAHKVRMTKTAMDDF